MSLIERPAVSAEAQAGDTTTGVPAPRRRRLLGIDRNMAVFWAVLIVLALLVLAPVVPTLYQSFRDRPLYDAGGIFTLENYLRLFSEAGFGQVILNTALFAGLTTIFTMVIAVPLAIIVVRTRTPGRRTIGVLMQWPFFISPLILGFGWITMYGPSGFVSVGVRTTVGFLPWDLYTLPGMAMIEAVALAPIAYVFCANALRNADASLEGAARTVGASSWRILRSVVFPMLRPPMVYSAVLIFTMSIETLSIPLIVGQPVGITVFSTFLYKNGIQSITPDYGVLGAASVVILLTTIVLVVIQGRLLKDAKRFVSLRGKATRPQLLDLGPLRWVGLIAVSAYLIFGALLPMLGLIARSFTRIFTPLQNPLNSLTWENYSRVLDPDGYLQSIINSLIVSGIGAVAVAIIATVAAVVARRSDFRFRKPIEYLALAPQAIPGLIVGIGLFWTVAWLPFGLGGVVQGTLLTIIVAFGLRAIPNAFGSVAPAIMQIGGEIDAAARVSGADWLRTFGTILSKLLAPAFISAIILAFVMMMKEYSPAVFLASANTGVIGTTMLELWVQGTTGAVAALATVQIIICTAFVAVANLFMKGHRNA